MERRSGQWSDGPFARTNRSCIQRFSTFAPSDSFPSLAAVNEDEFAFGLIIVKCAGRALRLGADTAIMGIDAARLAGGPVLSQAVNSSNGEIKHRF